MAAAASRRPSPGPERDLEAPAYNYEKNTPHLRFRPIANPAPLGLCGFALTTFVLSLINVGAAGVVVPNIVVGLGMLMKISLIIALAYGGAAQFAAGMWEFVCGNTFGALAFTSYGGFWISFAAIFIPGFDIAGNAGYAKNPAMLHNALGHYLICTIPLTLALMTLGWCIFTAIMLVGTLRTNLALFGLFFTLTLAFLMLAISEYAGNTGCQKAGGYFGLITATLAWYNAAAGLWNPTNSFVKLPLGAFPWAEKKTA